MDFQSVCSPLLMFRAVNTDTEMHQRQALQERKEIEEEYKKALESKDISNFMKKTAASDQNAKILINAKSNLLCNYIPDAELGELNDKIIEYSILEYKYPVFSLITRYLKECQFVRAKKILNLSIKCGWKCNELYSLEDELEKGVYGKD